MLDYLADLGEVAGKDSQILRRLSEAVRRENEGVQVPESDANSMIEPDEEEEPMTEEEYQEASEFFRATERVLDAAEIAAALESASALGIPVESAEERMA